MIQFGISPSNDAANQWRSQVDRFVEENQTLLAAIAWGLLQEWGDTQDVLGIDLQPQPHFVRCSRTALEQLNQQVNRKIQEILGILDGYKPEQEVAMIAIATGQIKLIYFQNEPFPPDCFKQITGSLDESIEQLENLMKQQINHDRE